jgi:Tol biopolymer transport system component
MRRRLVRYRRLIATRLLIAFLAVACLVLVWQTLGPRPARYRFEHVVAVDAANSDHLESSPACSSDGLELYFSSERPEGQGSFDIWVVRRPDPGKPWRELRNVEALNSPGHEEPAWLSPDGLRLYYVSNVHPANDESDRRKDADIFCATRGKSLPASTWNPWRAPDPFAGVRGINSEQWEGMPSLTSDEQEIYFSSDRPGGAGKSDIWVATRSDRDSPWGRPRNIEELNSPAPQVWPCISADGLTLWWNEFGYGEIRYSTREGREERFGKARSLDSPVNSECWEGHFDVSRDWPAPGSAAYFVRGYSSKTMDIYCARWVAVQSGGEAEE